MLYARLRRVHQTHLLLKKHIPDLFAEQSEHCRYVMNPCSFERRGFPIATLRVIPIIVVRINRLHAMKSKPVTQPQRNRKCSATVTEAAARSMALEDSVPVLWANFFEFQYVATSRRLATLSAAPQANSLACNFGGCSTALVG